MACFPTPSLFDAHARAPGNLLEFLDEIYPLKIRGIGYQMVKNFMIPTSTVFYLIYPCDKRTGGRQHIAC